MKFNNSKVAFVCFFLLGTLHAQEAAGIRGPDEVETLKNLVEITQKNLKEQERLLAVITRFRAARDAFIANSTSQKHGYALVRAAKDVEMEVASSNLPHLFSADFLEEIAFFAGAGKKSP